MQLFRNPKITSQFAETLMQSQKERKMAQLQYVDEQRQRSDLETLQSEYQRFVKAQVDHAQTERQSHNEIQHVPASALYHQSTGGRNTKHEGIDNASFDGKSRN